MKSRVALLLALPALLVAGCTEKSTEPPPDDGFQVVRFIDDINYVHGRYFLVQLPAERLDSGASIDLSTLRVFLDDMNGSNNFGARVGYGEIDPTLEPGDSPRLTGFFDQLQPLADYEVTTAPFDDRFPVLVLTQQLSSSQVLAVTYEEVAPGGARRAVGAIPDCGGVDCDSVRLRLLQAPRDVYLAKAGASDDYETDLSIAPLNVLREHELKNFYDLQMANIDPESFQLEVRLYDANLSDAGDIYVEGTQSFSYLRILGLDLFRAAGAGSPAVGPDGILDQFTDATFLDFERGTLMFPDLRPFDPRLPGRPDARPEELEFFRPRIAVAGGADVPGLRGRVFWPAGASSPPGSSAPVTPFALATNPHVYDRRNLRPTVDRRYFIHFKTRVPAVPGSASAP